MTRKRARVVWVCAGTVVTTKIRKRVVSVTVTDGLAVVTTKEGTVHIFTSTQSVTGIRGHVLSGRPL